MGQASCVRERAWPARVLSGRPPPKGGSRVWRSDVVDVDHVVDAVVLQHHLLVADQRRGPGQVQGIVGRAPVLVRLAIAIAERVPKHIYAAVPGSTYTRRLEVLKVNIGKYRRVDRDFWLQRFAELKTPNVIVSSSMTKNKSNLLSPIFID